MRAEQFRNAPKPTRIFPMSEERFLFGPFVMEPSRGRLTRNGTPVVAGARTLALLEALLRAGNGVASKHELQDAVWPGTAVEESNLSVQIASLRKLLGAQPDGSEWISTVPRLGYRFDGAIRTSAARTVVAVLPFAEADDGTGLLASGIADDIVIALARFGWFAVTAGDHAKASYRLQGSVRRSGNQLRVGANLVEVHTGLLIFAANFDTQLADVFAGFDEVAQRVAAAIEATLLRTDGKDARGDTPADIVKRGTGLFHRVSPATHREARDLFRAATRLAPDHAEAWAWLARVSAGLVAYGWSADPVADANEGVAAGLAGVRCDPASPYAHYGLAIVSIYADATDQAIRAARRAVAISSSFALGHLVHGLALLASGDADGAARSLERGLELSPGDPQGFAWLNFLALARLFSGAPGDAVAAAAQVLQLRPDWRAGHETMVCCQVAAGQLEDAGRTAARLARLPGETGGAVTPILAANQHWRMQMTKWLSQVTSGS
jgi:DNA-binding winged helix-turn-helix (wHTH) protein